MFRLFLKKKSSTKPSEVPSVSYSVARRRANKTLNKRSFARYSIESKHISLLNDQDIFLIRDISVKGLCSHASPRAFRRLKENDVYEARIKYGGEFYDLKIRVAWKAKSLIGFEMLKASRETIGFLKRLTKPMEIAASLEKVGENFTPEFIENAKIWFHGDQNTDLTCWLNPESGNLIGWQLKHENIIAEWSEGSSFTVSRQNEQDSIAAQINKESITKKLSTNNTEKQFMVDIIMAFHDPVRERILETIQ